VIIAAAALVIKFTGFYQIDPILGMLFGGGLFRASWCIIKEATNILLHTFPADFDLEKMVAAVKKLDSVEDAHHSHVWH